jgi:hypothetical protein
MPNLTAYSYRHTFATEWLKKGQSIELLAELMGNTPDVIRMHYSHLCGDRAALALEMRKFMDSRVGRTQTALPDEAAAVVPLALWPAASTGSKTPQRPPAPAKDARPPFGPPASA